MKKQKNNASGKSILSSILLILVSGSLCLAVIDKENRPAYFDIVKVAVGYAFGSLKLQSNTYNSNTPNDADDLQTRKKEKSEKNES